MQRGKAESTDSGVVIPEKFWEWVGGQGPERVVFTFSALVFLSLVLSGGHLKSDIFSYLYHMLAWPLVIPGSKVTWSVSVQRGEALSIAAKAP